MHRAWCVKRVSCDMHPAPPLVRMASHSRSVHDGACLLLGNERQAIRVPPKCAFTQNGFQCGVIKLVGPIRKLLKVHLQLTAPCPSQSQPAGLQQIETGCMHQTAEHRISRCLRQKMRPHTRCLRKKMHPSI